jgi:uncharacterized membrane protein YfcA
MPNINVVHLLLAVLFFVALWYIWRWWVLEHGRRTRRGLRPVDLGIGFGTNFFDTLGIGSFAPTTAIFKLIRRMPDEDVPGTLNVGQALPTLTEALIFIAIIAMDLTTLVTLLGMSPIAAFPIMMGSCALLMPVGGVRFVRARRYSPAAALALTLGGIPAVLCAAYLVRSLSIEWLHWLVLGVVLYAAVLMLLSARARPVMES